MSNRPCADEVRRFLRYEPETGRFTRIVGNGKGRAGSEAGTVHRRGYRIISVFGRPHLAHRLAWQLVHGEWPAGEIDHINGDKLDNRIANLRVVTRSVNLQNRRGAQRNNLSSGILGVTWNKRASKWQSQIKVGDRVKYLGLFDVASEGGAAYLAAKRAEHPGCTL